jgi:molecular chaperone GrpE (heat shock protein)
MLDRLQNVNTDNIEIRTLAQVFASDDWQQRLNEYNKTSGTTGLLLDASAVFGFTAAAIFALWLLYKFALLVLNKLFSCRNAPFISYRQPPDKHRASSVQNAEPIAVRGTDNNKISDLLAGSGWLNAESAEQSPADTVISEHENTQLLFSEKEPSTSNKALRLKADRISNRHNAGYIPEQDFEESVINPASLQKALAAQKKGLENQISEFQKVVETVRKTALQEPHPLGETVKELVQQVSAIREFAISQQDRIRKLQEGYDWNILKSFGLKVIRCIDNVEERIKENTKQRLDCSALQHIMDELIFALESSGIEQYKPQLNSDFKGQERIAEALRDRALSVTSDQKGKIAQVTRPGYRHFIDDVNFKIIRTATIKLFG